MRSFLSLSLLVVAAAATELVADRPLYPGDARGSPSRGTQRPQHAQRPGAGGRGHRHRGDRAPAVALVGARPPGGPQLVLLGGFAGLGALSWIDDRRGLSPAVRLGAQALPSPYAWPAADGGACGAVPAALIERLLGVLPGCGSSISSTSWTASTGWRVARPLPWPSAICAAVVSAGLDGPHWRLALVDRRLGRGLSRLELASSQGLHGRCRLDPAGLRAGLADAGPGSAADSGPRGLILPMYFVADATLTLLARAVRGEKPWQAHRQHFYQRAVLGGATPPRCRLRVGAANALLVTLALVSAATPCPRLPPPGSRGGPARASAAARHGAARHEPAVARAATRRLPAATA